MHGLLWKTTIETLALGTTEKAVETADWQVRILVGIGIIVLALLIHVLRETVKIWFDIEN